MAATIRRPEVRRAEAGGSPSSSRRAISSTAHAATKPFRRGSCRARCAPVHTSLPTSNADTKRLSFPSRGRPSGGVGQRNRTQTGSSGAQLS
jgi:hypothetical protein